MLLKRCQAWCGKPFGLADQVVGVRNWTTCILRHWFIWFLIWRFNFYVKKRSGLYFYVSRWNYFLYRTILMIWRQVWSKRNFGGIWEKNWEIPRYWSGLHNRMRIWFLEIVSILRHLCCQSTNHLLLVHLKRISFSASLAQISKFM